MDTTIDFTGCRVVVTDGTRGLGLSVARAFAERGAEVVVSGSRSRIATSDVDLTGLEHRRVDLTDATAVTTFADELGRIDVLVNAAGLLLPTSARERVEQVRAAVSAGAVGPLRLTRCLRPALAASARPGGGAVVHTQALREWFAFAHDEETSHIDLISQTARQAIEWRADGVRVNAVTCDDADAYSEAVAAVLFLASDAATGLRGQVLGVQAPLTRPAAPALGIVRVS